MCSYGGGSGTFGTRSLGFTILITELARTIKDPACELIETLEITASITVRISPPFMAGSVTFCGKNCQPFCQPTENQSRTIASHSRTPRPSFGTGQPHLPK